MRQFAPETVSPSPSAAESPPLEALRARVHGRLLEPADAGYEEARLVFNRAVDGRPTAIVQAADAADVAAAVAFAREHDLRLRVKAGGHSVAGHSTGDGLLIDLSRMRALEIHPERRTAWVDPGVTALELSEAAFAHGLAVPLGDAGSVGVAGLTLGGGVGYLCRKFGLTIDSLQSVELVTADAEIVRAAENENAELFWAVRGGGGNFGIVTSLEFRLSEIGLPYGGGLILPATRDVLRGLVPIAASAPEELTVICNILHAPPLPFVPAEAVGSLVVAILGVYVGDHDAGARAWAPFRELARPIADLVGPLPYPAMYQFTADEQPAPLSIRSLFLDTFDDASVDAVLEAMAGATSPATIGQLRILGGAMSRVAPEATAFAHRSARILFTIITRHLGPAPAEAHEAWTQRLYEALRPRAAGTYVNFLADEGEDRIREAYPEVTYRRLARLKAEWDPDNVFNGNQNIPPAPAW